MTYYIYKLTDDTNKIYIGSTNNYKRRMSNHRSKYNNCNSRLLNEDSFKSEILFEGKFDNIEDVINLEYSYIEYYKMTGNCINSNHSTPRKKNNCNNSKIYVIIDDTNNNKYIGSTIQNIKTRLTQHKASYKMYMNGKTGHTTSCEIIKNNNYHIELLENVKCNNKLELHKRERFWIEKIECINKIIPSRTIDEYYECNIDKIKEQRKKFYHSNKEQTKKYYDCNRDKIKEQTKKYYDCNIDKIKEQKKKYYDCNREREKQKTRKRYILNKDLILQKQREIYMLNKQIKDFCNIDLDIFN